MNNKNGSNIILVQQQSFIHGKFLFQEKNHDDAKNDFVSTKKVMEKTGKFRRNQAAKKITRTGNLFYGFKLSRISFFPYEKMFKNDFLGLGKIVQERGFPVRK